MRPEPEGHVAVGCAIQNDFVGAIELLLVVVGGQPADDDPVVFPEVLAAEFDVAGDGAAQRSVDREVAQEFVGGGAVQLGVVDELLPQFRVGAQVQQGQRGLRGGGVDAAGDQVPEDVEQLGVVEALAVEFELDEEAGQVLRASARRAAANSRTSSIMAGTLAMALAYSGLSWGTAMTEWKRLA